MNSNNPVRINDPFSPWRVRLHAAFHALLRNHWFQLQQQLHLSGGETLQQKPGKLFNIKLSLNQCTFLIYSNKSKKVNCRLHECCYKPLTTTEVMQPAGQCWDNSAASALLTRIRIAKRTDAAKTQRRAGEPGRGKPHRGQMRVKFLFQISSATLYSKHQIQKL